MHHCISVKEMLSRSSPCLTPPSLSITLNPKPCVPSPSPGAGQCIHQGLLWGRGGGSTGGPHSVKANGGSVVDDDGGAVCGGGSCGHRGACVPPTARAGVHDAGAE